MSSCSMDFSMLAARSAFSSRLASRRSIFLLTVTIVLGGSSCNCARSRMSTSMPSCNSTQRQSACERQKKLFASTAVEHRVIPAREHSLVEARGSGSFRQRIVRTHAFDAYTTARRSPCACERALASFGSCAACICAQESAANERGSRQSA
jgi:hypothetical protein